MTKKPLYNALAAFLYIVSIVLLMNWAGNNDILETSLLMPIMMLSLFTLSAAVMAYLFLYQPLMLYLEGKKKDAVNLFIKTLLIFAILPLSIFLLYFFNILS
ncbi:MAG: hypothetical protein WCY37_01015 [Candidatus Dojkabacteria bacterium]